MKDELKQQLQQLDKLPLADKIDAINEIKAD